MTRCGRQSVTTATVDDRNASEFVITYTTESQDVSTVRVLGNSEVSGILMRATPPAAAAKAKTLQPTSGESAESVRTLARRANAPFFRPVGRVSARRRSYFRFRVLLFARSAFRHRFPPSVAKIVVCRRRRRTRHSALAAVAVDPRPKKIRFSLSVGERSTSRARSSKRARDTRSPAYDRR